MKVAFAIVMGLFTLLFIIVGVIMHYETYKELKKKYHESDKDL